MKKGRFLWSAHRITKKQKAGKARNIKEKQLKNSRNTASRPPVVRLSSPSADSVCKVPEPDRFRDFFISPGVGGAFCHPVKSKTRTANAVRVVFSLPCSYAVLRVTPEKLNHPLASRQAPVRFSRSSHAVPLVYRGVST